MWMFIHPFCDFLITHDLACLLSQSLLSRSYLIASYCIKTTEFINKHFTSQLLLFIFPAHFLKYVYWNSSSISLRPFIHRSQNFLSVIVLLSSFLSLSSIQTSLHDYSHLFSCKYPLLLHSFLLSLYSFGKITVYKSKQLPFPPLYPEQFRIGEKTAQLRKWTPRKVGNHIAEADTQQRWTISSACFSIFLKIIHTFSTLLRHLTYPPSWL